MTPVEGSSASSSKSYWITRFMILRLLGGVYAVAFLVATRQLVPLVGETGLTPARAFLDRAYEHFGSAFSAFAVFPSIFWLNHSDLALQLVSWIGLILGCCRLGRLRKCPGDGGLVGALPFHYSRWAGLVRLWMGDPADRDRIPCHFSCVPLLDGRPFPRRAPPLMVIWLFRWLIFRIMLGAGLIKIRGDPAWRDLTALNYHFETQPIPNPLSRWFHFLPRSSA